jgi:hypothetical protein
LCFHCLSNQEMKNLDRPNASIIINGNSQLYEHVQS